jgi:murein DD-endopeptidase MepM/ murein hydrolase activator NlpD
LITLLVLRDAHASPRRIRLSQRGLRAAAAALVMLPIAVAALVIHYIEIAPAVFDARDLRRDNAALHARAAELTDRVGRIQENEEQLRSLQANLKKLSGVDDADVTLADRGRSALGGSNGIFDEPFAVATEDTVSRSKSVDAHLALMFDEVRAERGTLAELLDYFRGREALLRSTPSIAPTHGFLTSGFGTREDPFTNADSGHSGDDIAAPSGTEVVAPADGVVTLAGENGGYGNCVILEHRPGLTTVFGHLSSVLVHGGDRVVRGQRIGRVGSTGRSTGPHLHYEVRQNGVPLNPRRFIMR